MKVKFIVSTIISVLFTMFSTAQEDSILVQINESAYSLGEFEWMYAKNNQDLHAPSRKEYLHNFIDYKLKVEAAKDMNIHKSVQLIAEFENYSKLILSSYISERIDMDHMLREAFDRMKWDISMHHILIRIGASANPADTLAAYNKILKLRNRILSGEDFKKLAMQESEDPSALQNGGYYGFFTALTTYYPIETAAYNIPLNTVSEIIRAPSAYHLIMPQEKRPAYGRFKVADLFSGTTGEDSPEIQARAEKIIKQAYQDLETGKSFRDVGYSLMDDSLESTLAQESEMLRIGELGPDFNAAVLSLENVFEYSAPFKTPGGWHIIQLIEKQEIPKFEDVKSEIERKTIQLQRLQFALDMFEKRIQANYSVRENEEAFEQLFHETDQSILNGKWTGAGITHLNTVLFSVGNIEYMVSDFVSYVLEEQKRHHYYWDKRQYLDILYDQFKHIQYHRLAVSDILNKHHELKYLLHEFQDGLMIYEISDQQIWTRAVNDSSGLKVFYKDHIDNYMWKDRTDAYIITCGKDTKIRKIRKRYKRIRDGIWNEDLLNQKYCKNDSIQCIRVSKVKCEKGIYPRIDELEGELGAGPIYTNQNTNGFVIINEALPPEPKSLEVIRGDVVADYQAYLEEKWMQELKNKYAVKINWDLLQN